MIHHESIVADNAPEDSETEGRWDVIENPPGIFKVFDCASSMMLLREFFSLRDAVAEAQTRADEYDIAHPKGMDFPAMIEEDYEGAVALAERMLATLKVAVADPNAALWLQRATLPDGQHVLGEMRALIDIAEGRANGEA